jgi:type II secretion system protein I
MPTLKAGISMSKHEIGNTNACMITNKGRTRAFTFVEVIIALAIISVSLLVLLRLHITSVNMVQRAQAISQAVFLADEKIAEMLATGFPGEGTDSGTVEKDGLALSWRTEVADLPSAQLDAQDVSGLRKVVVDVSWKQGVGRKHMQMSTYVADRKLP